MNDSIIPIVLLFLYLVVIANIIYGFMFWGFWWGIFNVFFLFSLPIYDFLETVGRF